VAVVGNMTKFLTLIIFLTLLLSCSTTVKTFQTSDADKIGVKSNKFEGTIFKSTYPKDKLFILPSDSLTKFTPTGEDIKLAETILNEQIQKVNNPRINQFGKSQYIDKNLNKYFRQYVGFINEQGDSVIHINFHWNRFTIFDRIKGYWDDRLEYTSDFSQPLDGGSRYWNINVNLSEGHLYGLSVNGVG
jgi:hypothetical protein